ncbi:ThiF family adenylyltransferase [Bradyrhizobium yuanmingense]|uniref:ThiF family adenylyltransferase n=1 Tax=Bradyrhizobium yuanmingense TaxID=108015 RepID=UPI0023BA1E87|nr:ThiF family adenylyltransferase [Bradyrhizobium yuanmingense]MDF0584178.1 ThiF family adenylyltransferase [Bradyrhizobium yuanmingense]
MMSSLTLSGALHTEVQAHIYCGDGLEAAGLLLCARAPGKRLRLLGRTFIPVPHDACGVRTDDRIRWPGEYLELANDDAAEEGLSVIAIHSHPGGFFGFSALDDASDRTVMPCLFSAGGSMHGSAIMTPDGAVRARIYDAKLQVKELDLVNMAGDDLKFWWSQSAGKRGRPLAFTSGMTDELGRLTAVVIGVSGTGSIVAEQLCRLGFGRVILIDFDRIELKNLNRILNSRLRDAAAKRLKVEAFADAVILYRGDGVAVPVAASITTREAVEAAACADVLFSCVDTHDARQIADLMGASFLQPLFDVGVAIPVRKSENGPAISDVCGRIDYVQPGGPTLLDRGVYSPESLRAEYLRRTAPEAHRQEVQAGYIRGLAEEAPSVITLNMRAAAACMNEFIARAYPFRHEPNRRFARTEFSLAACEEEYTGEDAFKVATNPWLARGDLEPLLGMPALGPTRKSAA